MTASLRVELARAGHAPQLEQLFTRQNVPCFCRFWEYPGDKNGWLARCAFEADVNRRELQQALAQSGPRSPAGVVALSEDQAVGWMKLCFSEHLNKLYQQRPYRNLTMLTGQREGVLTIGCFLVDETFRRRGVAEALVKYGVAFGATAGARVIEAFPRNYSVAHDSELWTGPLAIFLRAGFEIVVPHDVYPVVRKTLPSAIGSV